MVFAGHGTTLRAPDAIGRPRLDRAGDGFFLKISYYVFRMQPNCTRPDGRGLAPGRAATWVCTRPAHEKRHVSSCVLG